MSVFVELMLLWGESENKTINLINYYIRGKLSTLLESYGGGGNRLKELGNAYQCVSGWGFTGLHKIGWVRVGIREM